MISWWVGTPRTLGGAGCHSAHAPLQLLHLLARSPRPFQRVVALSPPSPASPSPSPVPGDQAAGAGAGVRGAATDRARGGGGHGAAAGGAGCACVGLGGDHVARGRSRAAGRCVPLPVSSSPLSSLPLPSSLPLCKASRRLGESQPPDTAHRGGGRRHQCGTTWTP
jgi:hypothetical protein